MKTASELLKEKEIWFPAPMGGRKSKRQQVIEVMDEYSNQQLAEYKEKLKKKFKERGSWSAENICVWIDEL